MVRSTNAYAGNIPAFSCVQVTGAAKRTITINQPASNNIRNVMITGPNAIPQGAKGHCSRDWPLWVETTGSPSAGDQVGPTGSAWTMAKGNLGFEVLIMDGTLALVIPRIPSSGMAFTYVDGTGFITGTELTADASWHTLGTGYSSAFALLFTGYHTGSVPARFRLNVFAGAHYFMLYNDGVANEGGVCFVCPCEGGSVDYKIGGADTVHLYLMGYWAPA
jgi:hypothetical protein